jgi:hypothetical protein
MDKPHYIEALTKELNDFRSEFNDHVADNREWQIEHEAKDMAAFEKIDSSLARLSDTLNAYIKSNADMVKTWQTLPTLQRLVIYLVGGIVGIASVGTAIKTISNWLK